MRGGLEQTLTQHLLGVQSTGIQSISFARSLKSNYRTSTVTGG